MNLTTRKLLISCLGAFMVCLIASTATTVICAEESNVEESNAEEETYWGTLKVGDEMLWHWEPNFATSYTDVYYELKILKIQGESLKVNYHRYVSDGSRNYTSSSGRATRSSDELWPWIYPAALLHKNQDVKKTSYGYNGRTYTAAYREWYDESDSYHQYCWDYGTGILVRRVISPSGYRQGGPIRLEYTNANLTIYEPEPAAPYQFDPLQNAIVVFFVLVPIVIVVLISLARYLGRKKKHT